MNTLGKEKPQNIYDNQDFYDRYRQLRSKDSGLNGVLEIPALRALLPNMDGFAVLDLGCGFGDFARYAREEGAKSVTAVDVSGKMIAEARRLTEGGGITYIHCPMEEFRPGKQGFDLVVSSLALHYVFDYTMIVKRVFGALKNGGKFVFSVEHPVCTAYPIGWVKNGEDSPLYWPVDEYQMEGKRHTTWFVDGVVKFHRTVETYINTLINAGFRIDHVGEPKPLPRFLKERPSLERELRRPPFLLVAATKTSEPAGDDRGGRN